MCQLPFIRMWVRSTRPPDSSISRCLPFAVMRSMVLPVMGASSSTRVSAGSTDSNRTIFLPASARFRVRAARKMVSPSGMPPHLEAHRGRTEARLEQVRGEG